MNNKDMPAMPLTGNAYEDFMGKSEECRGLTKLEHFAGLAMQAMISSKYYADFAKVEGDMEKAVAINAISHAKALLTQLEGESNE